MATIGTRTSSNTESGIVVKDFSSKINRLAPEQSPCFQFYMSKDLRQEVTSGHRSKFEWEESEFFPTTTTLTAGLTGGSATEAGVTLGNDYLRAYDTCYVQATGELLLVTAVATGTMDVKRVGGGNITAAAAGSVISILPGANKENYTSPEAKSTNPTTKYGYCQIMIEPIQITGRQQASKKYTGNEWKRIVRERLEEMKRDIDKMILINPAAYDDSSADVTFSAGFKGVITTNVKYYSGELDEIEVDEVLDIVMQRSTKLIGWAGSKYLNGMNKFMKDIWTYNTDDVVKMYGGITKNGTNPEVLTYRALKGPVYYVWDPLLDDLGLTGSCLYVTPDKTRMRFMDDDEDGPRKFRLEKRVQTPGAGNRKDQFVADIGLDVVHEKMHAWHHMEP